MPRVGYVYVVASDELPDRAKVGFASDLTRRMRSLQTGCPVELRLIHHVPAPFQLEKYLKWRLSGYGTVPGTKEWFYLEASKLKSLLQRASFKDERLIERERLLYATWATKRLSGEKKALMNALKVIVGASPTRRDVESRFASIYLDLDCRCDPWAWDEFLWLQEEVYSNDPYVDNWVDELPFTVERLDLL